MFLKRKKVTEPAPPAKACGGATGAPVPGLIARHIGEIWHVLQGIAAEEDPRFQEKSLVEHFNASAEGTRDVVRWINIYQRQVNPHHTFEFPAHWRRHRGHVLVARNWPEGTLWEAFDEKTWFRTAVAPQPSESALVQAVDTHLAASELGSK